MTESMAPLSALMEGSLGGTPRIEYVVDRNVRIDQDWAEDVRNAWIPAHQLLRHSGLTDPPPGRDSVRY